MVCYVAGVLLLLNIVLQFNLLYYNIKTILILIIYLSIISQIIQNK